jgi:RNA polymerase sigma factor (sigma-70 family)
MAKLSLVPGGQTEQNRFESLIEPHYATLHRVAYRFTGSLPDAEDLVQETCVRAYRHIDKLCGLEDPRGWMILVMRRLFIDQTRRYDRNNVRSIDEAPEGSTTSDRPDPAEAAESELMARRIQRGLKRLSNEHRALLVLHDMEGYSLQELEQITGVKIGTIKSRLHRARVKLGRLLQSDRDFAAADVLGGVRS